jgi:hypothetical protein
LRGLVAGHCGESAGGVERRSADALKAAIRE